MPRPERIKLLASLVLAGITALLLPSLARQPAGLPAGLPTGLPSALPWLALLCLAVVVAAYDVGIYLFDLTHGNDGKLPYSFIIYRLVGSLLLMVPVGLALIWRERLPRLASRESLLLIAMLASLLLVRLIRLSQQAARSGKKGYNEPDRT